MPTPDSKKTVSCSPAGPVINQAVTCTATVSDASANGTAIRPSGTVSFSKAIGDAGGFDNTSSKVDNTAANNSSSHYIPSPPRGTTITVDYRRDSNHTTSFVNVTLTPRKSTRFPSTTLFRSGPVINQAVTCTATVSDASANGTAIRPSGTVSFSKAIGDAGGFDNTS